MAARVTRVQLNQGQINQTVRFPGGPVYREVAKYGRRVTTIAKANSPVGGGDPDRGHAAGTMKRGIKHEMSVRSKLIVSRTVSPAPYTKIVHEGRGPVRVKRAKALKFKPKGSAAYIFRPKVGPAAAQPFMREALEAGQPWPVRKAS